jgi:hypothetical protein
VLIARLESQKGFKIAALGNFGDFGNFPEDALCDPYGGPAMIAWLLAFLGFPPPFGIPESLSRLCFCCLL